MPPADQNIYDDKELVERFRKSGDLNILAELYKQYMVLVYGLCMKYLKNREDSQDAVMQIFEVLIKDIPRFEIRNFKSWLYGVSRNHCLMKLRKDQTERIRSEISSEMFMESDEELHLFDDNGDENLQHRLKACLEKLKEEQRRCIELFYYDFLCYKEISSKLLIDENKVKSHIQNGKRNLKICIETKPAIGNAEHRKNI